MKRDSILPEKDITSFFERCLSFRKRCYVFFGKILVFPEKILRLFKFPTQLNIKITLHGTSPLSILPSPLLLLSHR